MICYLYMGTTFAILPRAGICQAFCPEVDQKSDPGINFINKNFWFFKFFFIFSNHLVIVVYGPNFSHLTQSTWPQEQKEDPKKVLSKKGKNFSNFSSSAPGPLRAQLWYLWAMLHLMVGPHPIWPKSETCPVLTG